MSNEAVVLLHGIARTKYSMKAIEKSLIKEGYQVWNIDYPSRKKHIADLATFVFNEITARSQDNNTILHFVVYSTGAIIVRELLAKHTLLAIGNIVMLAPPNQGSEVADFLDKYWLYRYFYGPAGSELTTYHAKSNPFPKMQHTCGVIAGNFCLDPFSYFILPRPHDGKVTIQSTKLEGMTDHIVLPCSHTFIITNKKVIEQIQYFLKHRKFYLT